MKSASGCRDGGGGALGLRMQSGERRFYPDDVPGHRESPASPEAG